MTRGGWVTRVLAVPALLVIAGGDLSAELKYTIRVESHPSAGAAPAAASDPGVAALGQVLLDMIVPNGPITLTCTIGSKVGRIEWSKPQLGIPAGAALIKRADGTTVMVNFAEKTFWRVGVTNLFNLGADRKPQIVKGDTGETAAVVGVAAAHWTADIRIPFPEARSGTMIIGTPKELPVSGDAWVTDRFAEYVTPATRSLIGLAVLGFDIAPAGGFIMRQILRGPLLGTREIESIVLGISEEAVPASTFEVPADFKEVPPPRIVGG